MQRQVLFRDQPGSNSGPQVFVEKSGDRLCVDIFPTLQEPLRQDRDGVRMRLHQIRHDVRKLFLIFEVGDVPFLIGQEGR